MGNRFVGLTLLTSTFQVICALTLVLGIFTLVTGLGASGHGEMSAANPFAPQSNDIFAQIPAGMKVAAGAILAFYGLTGLVFSGGINVLVSIDHEIRSLSETLPTILAKPQPASPGIAEYPAPLPKGAVSVAAASDGRTKCVSCNNINEAGASFCDKCGKPLDQN